MLSGYMGFILNYDQIGLHVSCSNRFTLVKMAADETTKTLNFNGQIYGPSQWSLPWKNY